MVVKEYLVRKNNQFVILISDLVDFEKDEHYLNLVSPTDFKMNKIMKGAHGMDPHSFIDNLIQTNLIFIKEIVNMEIEEGTRNVWDLVYTQFDYGNLTKSMGPYTLLKQPNEKDGVISLVNQSYATIWANFVSKMIKDEVCSGTHWAIIMKKTEEVLQHVAIHILAIIDIKDTQCRYTMNFIKHYNVSLHSLRKLVYYEVMASIAVRIYMINKTEGVMRYGHWYEYTLPMLYTKYTAEAHDFARQMGLNTVMVSTFMNLFKQLSSS